MTVLWSEQFEGLMRASLPGLAPGAPLEPDAVLPALGLDSMGTVGLIAALEEEYGVNLLDDVFGVACYRTPAGVWSTLCAALSRTAT